MGGARGECGTTGGQPPVGGAASIATRPRPHSSRLDSFIRRLRAQRACLDHAARLIAGRPGPVLELGLGNGRTFDHLRHRLAGREIFVFERRPDPHPDCAPDPAHLIVGELEETLVRARGLLPEPAALVHSDIGTGDALANTRTAALIATLLPALLHPGAIVVSDQELNCRALVPLALPPHVARGRYFLYRHT